jgi:hypothetical protein
LFVPEADCQVPPHRSHDIRFRPLLDAFPLPRSLPILDIRGIWSLAFFSFFCTSPFSSSESESIIAFRLRVDPMLFLADERTEPRLAPATPDFLTEALLDARLKEFLRVHLIRLERVREQLITRNLVYY